VSRDQEKSVQRRIFELQIEHRDLDDIVARLADSPNIDQLLITRLKKRKLQLKDQITKLKSALIPDLNA
jgi:hypothetical protein